MEDRSQVATGNTVVLKPSSSPHSPRSVCRAGGGHLPAGCVQRRAGPGRVRRRGARGAPRRGDGVDHRRRVDRQVDRLQRAETQAGAPELGGKALVIVFDTPIPQRGRVRPRATTTQVRLHRPVPGDRRSPGVRRRGVGVDRLRCCAALVTLDPDVAVGPVISAEQQAKVAGMVERAAAAGAEVTVGGAVGDRTALLPAVGGGGARQSPRSSNARVRPGGDRAAVRRRGPGAVYNGVTTAGLVGGTMRRLSAADGQAPSSTAP